MENEINTTQTSVLRLSPDMPVSEMMHAVSVDSAEFEIPVDATVDEFMHSGVKGMKWGVRRYQNKDGTLTAAGKKREASERKSGSKKGGGALKKAGKNIVKKLKDRKEAKDKEKAEEKLNKQKAKSRKKNIADMTDDELKDYIDRKKLERDAAAVDDQIATFRSHARNVGNQSPSQNPDQPPVSKKISNTLVNDVVVPSAVSAGKTALTSFMTKSFNKALGLSDDADDAGLKALRKTAEEAGLQKTIADMRKATAEAIEKERKNAEWEREHGGG